MPRALTAGCVLSVTTTGRRTLSSAACPLSARAPIARAVAQNPMDRHGGKSEASARVVDGHLRSRLNPHPPIKTAYLWMPRSPNPFTSKHSHDRTLQTPRKRGISDRSHRQHASRNLCDRPLPGVLVLARVAIAKCSGINALHVIFTRFHYSFIKVGVLLRSRYNV